MLTQKLKRRILPKSKSVGSTCRKGTILRYWTDERNFFCPHQLSLRFIVALSLDHSSFHLLALSFRLRTFTCAGHNVRIAERKLLRIERANLSTPLPSSANFSAYSLNCQQLNRACIAINGSMEARVACAFIYLCSSLGRRRGPRRRSGLPLLLRRGTGR